MHELLLSSCYCSLKHLVPAVELTERMLENHRVLCRARVLTLTPIGRVFLLKGVNSITLEDCMGGGKNPPQSSFFITMLHLHIQVRELPAFIKLHFLSKKTLLRTGKTTGITATICGASIAF